MVKNVSKVLSLLMSVVMLMGILSVPMTFTAAEPVQLSLGSAKGAAGDIVTIPFTISANSTAVIGQFKLSYDIYKLEYLGSEYSGLLDDNRDIIRVVSSVATSSIAFGFRYGESSGITGEGALFTFRFKIKTDLTAPVNLTLDFDTSATSANALLGWGNTTIPHAFSNGTVSPLGYAITFDFNDGTPPITVWVNEGEKPTPPDHTRQGYSLNRWSPAVFVAAHEDATYTAYWSVHYYSVIYAGNGNDGPSTESSSHTYNQEKALTLNEFTKTGYTFIDWNTKQDGTGISYADGQIVKNLSATQGDNFKLYAQWAINSYNLTYDANGGTGGTGPTATGYGTTLTAPTVTREGYTFMGWNPEVVATMPAADTVYKALWEEIVIATGTVTFDTGGGNAIAAITGEVGTTVTEPADPTREGYTFNGWLPAMPAVIPAENVNCVAQWTLNEYTITFDANDGVGGEVQTVEHGTRPVAPEVTREGFTFIEWTAEIVAATGDTTYTAQWTINEYTITFDANGGAGGETQAVEHGTIPDTPVVAREGYTFNGWGVEIAPATEDATYTAQWTANQYTINFDSNGGTEVEDITEDFATALSAPADPTKEGYTFNGWSPAVPVTMPAENVNCVAQWTINEYTITFDANDGVGGEVQTVEHGTRPVAPEVTREGFAFTEWTPEIVAATEDATYTATWEKIESEDEDEDVPSEETVPKEDAPADDVTDNVIDEDEVAKDVVVDEVPETGSTAAGIAVFATLSMAAAAAFVLGKRKED